MVGPLVASKSSERRSRDECFVANPDRALWLGTGLLALVVLLALFVPSHPLAVDRHWSQWMTDVQTPGLEHAARALNDVGRGLVRVLPLVAVGLLLLVARRWLALLAFALTESLTPLLSSVVKQLVDRPRPPGGLVHLSDFSFPSGHAAYAGATCAALVLLFTSPGSSRRVWAALAACGIVAMAWSRTYLQVHWLSDALAGSLLGVGIALLVFGVVQRGLSRPPRASPRSA
jgi:undecaprenyl-diphosphatase